MHSLHLFTIKIELKCNPKECATHTSNDRISSTIHSFHSRKLDNCVGQHSSNLSWKEVYQIYKNRVDIIR